VNDLVANLVDRALAFRQEDRWPNAAAFRQAARAVYGSIAEQPIERAPKLSVRPVPNGPMSVLPPASEAREFGPAGAGTSSRGLAISARSLERTKLVAGRSRSPILRAAIVVATAAVALFAFTLRGGARPPLRSQQELVHAAAPAPVPKLTPAPEMAPSPKEPMDEHAPAADIVAGLGPALPELEPAPLVKAPAEEAPLPAARSPRRTRASRATEAPAEPEAPIASPSASPKTAESPSSNEGHAVDIFSRRR
jgi:hypothetical protein